MFYRLSLKCVRLLTGFSLVVGFAVGIKVALKPQGGGGRGVTGWKETMQTRSTQLLFANCWCFFV